MQATTRYIPVSSPFYKTHSQATRTLIKHCKFWLACNKKDYSGYLFGASLLSRSASQRFLEACFWQPVPNTTGGSFCRKTSTVRINPHCSSKHLLIELSGYGIYIYISYGSTRNSRESPVVKFDMIQHKTIKQRLDKKIAHQKLSNIPNRIYKCFTNMITQPTVPVMPKALQAKFLAYHPGPSKGHPPEHFHSSCWQKKRQKLLRHSNSDAELYKGAKDASLLPKIQALSCPSEIEKL